MDEVKAVRSLGGEQTVLKLFGLKPLAGLRSDLPGTPSNAKKIFVSNDGKDLVRGLLPGQQLVPSSTVKGSLTSETLSSSYISLLRTDMVQPSIKLFAESAAAAHVTCAKYARSVKALQDETGSVSDLDSSLESSACGLKPATAQQLRHQGSLSGAQVPFPSNDLPSRAHP